MPRRPTPPQGEGGRPPVPVQETAVPVEKKKVDAAFWDKFKEFQKMPPEERFEAIESFIAGYEKPRGEESMKMDIFAILFVHPEWCCIAALKRRWLLERGPQSLDSEDRRREHWKVWSDVEQRKAEILENVGGGHFPIDEELQARLPAPFDNSDMLHVLHQGSMQETMLYFSPHLKMLGQRYNIPELQTPMKQTKLFGMMTPEQLKEFVWGYLDSGGDQIRQKELFEKLKKDLSSEQ